ncbi:DUF7144 family membrane protein [Actinomycetospora sp.]|jgi:hypothetical protein|uniref:DUF7144 family membrane protein n=1 Tax=Actinomycetospora sp. TaxID=1872135 RepID=UPI002F415CC2
MRRRTRWGGWLAFGAVLMMVIGLFAVFEGLLALRSPDFFVAQGGRVLALNLAGWGWLHLVLGLLVLAAGATLFGGGARWAGGVGIAVIAVNLFVQLVWLPAFPIWSIIIIALDLLVLYAIAATWPDRRVSTLA